MRRTTTATHRLTFPMTLALADTIVITYAQGGENLVVKGLPEVDVDDKAITVHLSESETKKFRADEPVELQVKFRSEGEIYATQIQRVPMRRILNDELIEPEPEPVVPAGDDDTETEGGTE